MSQPPRPVRDLAAVILAAAVAVTMILASVDELRQHGHVTAEEANLLTALAGVAIGAVSVYLGTRGGPNGSDRS